MTLSTPETPPAQRPRPTEVRPLPDSTPAAVEPALPGGVVAATTEALTAAGRLGTPLGALALNLAKSLADGGHTASGLAALSKELRGALNEALADAPKADDSVDELAERRLRKAAGA